MIIIIIIIIIFFFRGALLKSVATYFFDILYLYSVYSGDDSGDPVKPVYF